MTEVSDLAVWLYGSKARGDADEFSDIDVLLVSKQVTDHIIHNDVLEAYSPASVSRYSWDEIERMAQYGSLFLRHLELEGRPLYESLEAAGRLREMFSALGPYTLAARDVRGFRTVLGDVASALESDQPSLIFELSTLGTLFRHASILGCALSGSHCFSRLEPVARLVALLDLPKIWPIEFPTLYSFRMYAENRTDALPQPSADLGFLWIERTSTLVEKLEEVIDEND